MQFLNFQYQVFPSSDLFSITFPSLTWNVLNYLSITFYSKPSIFVVAFHINIESVNFYKHSKILASWIVFCSFAAALKDINVWVLNVVPIDSADTLPIIYERGLFGIYHDWCESFSTYPRTYDLLHADHLFSLVKSRLILYIFSLAIF